MKVLRSISLVLLGLAWIQTLHAQDLDQLLEMESQEPPAEAMALFKSTRIVNGHSVKQFEAGQLDYRISHRFGQLNMGAYEFFGLDHSTIHLSLEYAPVDWVMFGAGRATHQKTMDAFVKFRLTRQADGDKAFPFSSSWVSSIEMWGLKWENPERDNRFQHRLSYVHQLLIARKFGGLTLQVMPSVVHRNLVQAKADVNDLFSIGAGLRYKLNQRLALTAEYYYVFHPEQPSGGPFHNPLSIGLDIETGGHVFQLAFSNAIGMREGTFLGQTTGNWLDGGIHFGFNISRVFQIH